MSKSIKKTNHPYIVCNPEISNGSPTINGTRMRVMDIAIEYEELGLTPNQIVEAFPHLKLEQVHDALSYYYENIDYFNKKKKKNKEILRKLKKKYPSILKDKIVG